MKSVNSIKISLQLIIMPQSDLLIVHPSNPEQTSVVKAFLSALNIEFEQSSTETYHPEFVAKIQQSRKDFAENKGRVVQLEELEKLWK